MLDLPDEIRNLIMVAVYVVIGFLVYNAIKVILKKHIERRKARLKRHQYQRLNTVRTVLTSLIKYAIIISVALASLAQFGVDVSSLLAGIGIGAAVLGLAFQDFAKDIIAGLSILTEGQYEVGDTIEVDGFRGKVIYLGLKTTKIKNYRGRIKVMANRNMDTLINYTDANTLAEVDVSVAYEHDSEEVEKVLNKVKQKLDGSMPAMRSEISILGITDLGDSGVTWRLTVDCAPNEHFAVQRAIRREVKAAFDKAGITIPYPQVVVHKA